MDTLHPFRFIGTVGLLRSFIGCVHRNKQRAFTCSLAENHDDDTNELVCPLCDEIDTECGCFKALTPKEPTN